MRPRGFILQRMNEARPAGQLRAMNDSAQREVHSGTRFLGGKAYPNGKPSSWVLVAAVIAAFMSGGIGIILQSWWLFWLSVAVILLGMPASWLVGIMAGSVASEIAPENGPAATGHTPATVPWRKAA